MNRNYVTKEQVEAAKRLDLFSYLAQYEPQELRRVSGNVYCTAEHDSLKISNGKWYWWSRGFGGKTALDYLIKVQGYDFVSAVKRLADNEPVSESPAHIQKAEKPNLTVIPQQLFIPEKDVNNDKVIHYLMSRGISKNIIMNCINKGIIYQEKRYKNCCFVGNDENGKPRHIVTRSTYPNSTFVGESKGSDKAYPFRIYRGNEIADLYVFESAIDLLSFLTLVEMYKKPIKGYLLSLSGINAPTKDTEYTIPIALKNALKTYPNIRNVSLCFDADDAGTKAARALNKMLEINYNVSLCFPPIGKDMNDFLMDKKGLKGIATRRSAVKKGEAR